MTSDCAFMFQGEGADWEGETGVGATEGKGEEEAGGAQEAEGTGGWGHGAPGVDSRCITQYTLSHIPFIPLHHFSVSCAHLIIIRMVLISLILFWQSTIVYLVLLQFIRCKFDNFREISIPSLLYPYSLFYTFSLTSRNCIPEYMNFWVNNYTYIHWS